MNGKKTLICFMIVAVLLSCSLAFPGWATSSDWSKPRSSEYTLYEGQRLEGEEV
jgi:hypothetical protein